MAAVSAVDDSLGGPAHVAVLIIVTALHEC